MTEIETMMTNKPWYKRVIACFCAFLICCLVCFCGFAIPKVHAESIADQFEDYIDSMTFEGASTIAETFTETVADSYGLGVVFDSVMIGLNMIESNHIGTSIPLNNLSSCSGYYFYNSEKVFCSTTLPLAFSYTSDSGGLTVAKSKYFDCRYNFVYSSPPETVSCNIGRNGGLVSCSGSCLFGVGSRSFAIDLTGGSSIFPNYTLDFGSISGSRQCSGYFGYATVTIPTLSDNMVSSSYIIRSSPVRGYSSIIAGGIDNPNFNWSDVLPFMGVDPNVSIDPFNIYDFIENDFNPVIIENYPQLVQYLFVPQETPTETTSLSGCGCHVDVYVEPTIIVEPTINVYVNPCELPSDEQDFTLPTTPAHETIPFPTQDSSNTEPVTMPTLDLEEFQQTYKNAFDFWFYCAEQLIEKMNLQILLAFVFVVTVVGFIMWKLGG